MQIDLTNEVAAALLALMDRATAIDVFSLMPLPRTLPSIRRKILGAAPSELVDKIKRMVPAALHGFRRVSYRFDGNKR